MASRVYEKTAMRLIKLSHHLEDLKPTAQELDVERFRTDVGMLESSLHSIIDRRESTMRREGKLDKGQMLCRRCGQNPTILDKNECGVCDSKTALEPLERMVE